MVHIVRIECPPQEMRDQVPGKLYNCYIELRDYSLYGIYEFIAQEPIDKEDRSLGEEKVSNCFIRVLRKEHILGIDLEYIQKTKSNKNPQSLWCIEIGCNGFQSNWKLWFVNEESARGAFDKISGWYLRHD